jgi:hypothetical protein
MGLRDSVQAGLFRQRALEQLSSPDQLDHLMQVTSAKAWLALVGLASVVVAAVLWGCLGRIPVEVNGEGILLRPPGIYRIFTESGGVVTAVGIADDKVVRAGQMVARIRSRDGMEQEIRSESDGLVLQLLVQPHLYVAPGTKIASLEPLTDELRAVVYVPAGQAKSIQPGMTVHLSPVTIRPEEHGVMLGRVSAVGEFPVTEQRMNLLVQNDAMNKAFAADGPVHEVQVDVVRDDATPSGFKWSSRKGPPTRITSGTLTSAAFVLTERRPISLIFPTANP